MGKFFRNCLNGLAFGIKPWLLFGVFLPILFFIFHPFDPILVFGVSILAVVLYFSNKWKKEMPAARQATEEAVKSGVKFEEQHPTDETKESPLKRYQNKFYPMLWSAILSACMLSCSYQIIHNSTSKNKKNNVVIGQDAPVPTETNGGRTVALAEKDSTTLWNADNIEMVHLKDASQYVTNSDSILSDTTVAAMNAILKDLDSIAHVKPVIVMCRKTDAGGTYSTAVNLINKYHIANEASGQGICVVVAYDQHQYTIAPSKELEDELTDVECSQLGRNFLQPFLKVQQPDSAMLYLSAALYKVITEKQAEASEGISLSSLKSGGIFSGQSGLNILVILVLCMIFGIYDDKNKWTKPAAMAATAMSKAQESHDVEKAEEEHKEKLVEKPHVEPPVNKGGRFGGGSSGGAGATGDW